MTNHQLLAEKLTRAGYARSGSTSEILTLRKTFPSAASAEQAASNFGKSNPQGRGPVHSHSAFGNIHEVSLITTGETYDQWRARE